MTDFTITIDDPDALDAINNIIAANGTGEKPEPVIVGLLVPQLVAMRLGQLEVKAQTKATQDPDVLAFQDRQAKIKAEADAASAAVQEVVK